jgi:YVTN family beta-propeller protein
MDGRQLIEVLIRSYYGYFNNKDGNQVYPSSISYLSSNSDLVSVSTGGSVCAGKWDSLTAPVVCTPATTPGTATITVAAGSVNGSATIYVHPTVDRIVIDGSIDLNNCVSIAATAPGNQARLSAKAFSGSTDVTKYVGPFNWSVETSTVATVDNTGLCSSDNTCAITATGPGQTNIKATVGTSPGKIVVSAPGTFTSCPVQSIKLTLPGTDDRSVTLNNGGTQALELDVRDSKGNKLVDNAGLPLSGTGVAYFTSQPLAATVSAGTITAASAGGSTTVGAYCLPALGCNAELSPVYSNTFKVKVNSSSTANTTTVYVASTTGKSLIPVDTSTNTPSTAIALPYTPNSIAMARSGAVVYLGSDNGLMVVNTTDSSVATNTTAVGKVISVSPNSNFILTYKAPTLAPGTGTLYRFNPSSSTSGASVLTFPISGAGTTAIASWAPDSSTGYIVTGTKLIVLAGLIATPYDIGQVNDVDFLAQGSFAYLSGGGADVTVRATCNSAQVDTKSIGGAPAFLRSVPDGSAMLALYPLDLSTAAQRYLNPITVETTGAGCPPNVTNTPGSPIALGSFIPGQMILSPDSSKAYITAADSATVYTYDIATKAVTQIPLQGGATGVYGGGLTLDSTRLYVGAKGSDDLHVINTSNNTDEKQISIGFQPDLVAVKPK